MRQSADPGLSSQRGAKNGTPVQEPLTTLGTTALTLVQMLVAPSELQMVRSLARPLKMALEVEGISRAVGKFSKLVLLHALLNADTT